MSQDNNNSYNYCNGKASTSVNKDSSSTVVRSPQAQNLNWLLYWMYSRGDYANCKILIQKQIRDNYEEEYLFHIQGLIDRDEGRLGDALTSFKRAVELNPKSSNNSKELAKTYYQMHRHKQALEMFFQAEKLMQRVDHEIYYYIGDLLYRSAQQQQGKIHSKEYKDYFKQAIMNGKHKESYLKLAEIYAKEKDYPKAIEMYESCLQVSHDSIDILTKIGLMYLKIGENQRAFEKLLDVTHLDDQHTNALMALGAILQSKHDIDGALNKYKRIPKIHMEGGELWSNIAMCFFRKRKFVAAIACLKKSVWVAPLNFNILYNLGLVLLTAHQYASAFQVFAAGVNLRPDNAECYMLLGVCLTRLNDKQNAYVAFEKSVTLPDALKNPLIYLNFAVFCYQNDRPAQALQFLNNFLEMAQNMDVNREHAQLGQKLHAALAGTVINVDVEAQKHPKLGAIPSGSIEAQPGSRGESSTATRDNNDDDDDEYFA
ncbi:Bardet-Biedl syndrome 4 protein homolog [Culicoides brevitarsis]|uniref:Bardet-Biedl syndrome 4 protein homolog n=1 Tax=Culicoides brevitarsis TaxID=469753 RepID=UPI00307C07A4